MPRAVTIHIAAAVTARRQALLNLALDLASDDLVAERRVSQSTLAVTARPCAVRVTDQTHPVICKVKCDYIEYTSYT